MTVKRVGLFLESEPSGGGTFQYNQLMLDAVAALPGDQFSVVVAYVSDNWLKYLPASGVKSVKVHRGFWARAVGLAWTLSGLPMGLWRRICPAFHPMAQALLNEHADLWIFPSQDARGFQLPVPALVSIHDLMHRYESRFPESGSRWELWNRERSYTNICRWARGVLVDSELGRAQVVESYGISAKRVHVLPYVAPRYMWTPSAPAGFDERHRLPGKFLFYPARFWAHKNHVRLVQAMAAAKPRLPGLKLVLAGTRAQANDSFGDVMAEVGRLGLAGDVQFLGYVPDEDMPELYRRARALVMPTYFGPTNIPPLEAFVAGCPVAVSRRYGMPEQVGEAALLFDPDSVSELASCIERLWADDDLCRDLAARGRARAAQWGPPQFGSLLREIIDSVLASAEASGGRAGG